MRRQGFSLAEVILSTLIISLVMMTVFSLFPSSALAVKKGENRLTAEALAQAGLEECRGLSFEALALDNDFTVGNVTIGNTVFERTRQIFVPPGSPDDKLLKGVRMRIAWTEQGKPVELQAETWIVNVER